MLLNAKEDEHETEVNQVESKEGEVEDKTKEMSTMTKEKVENKVVEVVDKIKDISNNTKEKVEELFQQDGKDGKKTDTDESESNDWNFVKLVHLDHHITP